MQDKYKIVDLIKTYPSRNIHGLGVVALALLGLVTAPAAWAQSYTLTTLVSFSGGASASYPYSGLILSGGALYGTTIEGGGNSWGTVYSVPTTVGTPTVLATFNYNNGEALWAGLTLNGSTLYGTAIVGGASNDGVVFSVPITGGTPAVLATFNGTNGSEPHGGLVVSGSTLYGTTPYGGANGDGTVFSIPTTGGAPTVLASFNVTDGAFPQSDLTLIGSTLYGTTYEGGAYGGVSGFGTVFSIPTTGGIPTTLASFNGDNGAYPRGGLTLSGSTFYGTTYAGGAYGGANGHGTVYSIPMAGGTPTVLASFNGANGRLPVGDLALSGSSLYGITFLGGANDEGTVFSLTPDQSPVPEASSVVSLGLLLALGLGGMFSAAKRARKQGKERD